MPTAAQTEAGETGRDRGWAAMSRSAANWGPAKVAIGARFGGINDTTLVGGHTTERLPWASVTKLVTTLTCLIAIEEGTVRLDDPVEVPGIAVREITLSMLLSHASGLQQDFAEVAASPLTRRIYSNAGIRMAARHVERSSGFAFEDYCREAVLEPLGMLNTIIDDPAAGGVGPLVDLMLLLNEFMTPTLIADETLRSATTIQWPGLAGILPGFGRQTPNPWGVGVEVRGQKHPHWTGQRNSPSTFGHFGQSGSMLWVDPIANVGACSLSSQPFGQWAVAAWPTFSDSVLDLLRTDIGV